MPRHANVNWNLNEAGTPVSEGVSSYSFDTIQTAVLMDIRDELQRLNALFRCHNFLEIPYVLRQIRANTSKPKRRHDRSKSKKDTR